MLRCCALRDMDTQGPQARADFLTVTWEGEGDGDAVADTHPHRNHSLEGEGSTWSSGELVAALLCSRMEIRHPPEHLLVHDVARHAAPREVPARAEHARSDRVDALVGQADVMRRDDQIVEL